MAQLLARGRVIAQMLGEQAHLNRSVEALVEGFPDFAGSRLADAASQFVALVDQRRGLGRAFRGRQRFGCLSGGVGAKGGPPTRHAGLLRWSGLLLFAEST